MTPAQVQIIGCGNIGSRVAALCRAADFTVNAWVRSAASQRSCREAGLDCRRIDLDHSVAAEAASISGRLLYTVPPPRHGREDTRLTAFLETLDPRQIKKFILISTSGVYGDCNGDWIDETRPIRPKAERALRRVDAENRLLGWADQHKIDYLILRVPGIYSLDRLPIERLREMKTVVTRKQAPWTNRVHADDLAAACLAALRLEVANEIINIADDVPSTMTDYFFAVADFAGVPRPLEISLDEAATQMSPGMLSYLAESRRIRNSKMKSLLGLKLRYPSLDACLKA